MDNQFFKDKNIRTAQVRLNLGVTILYQEKMRSIEKHFPLTRPSNGMPYYFKKMTKIEGSL